MNVSPSQIWTRRHGHCGDTPFKTGIDRALAIAFPPQHEETLPDRIAEAMLMLDDEAAGDEAPQVLSREVRGDI